MEMCQMRLQYPRRLLLTNNYLNMIRESEREAATRMRTLTHGMATVAVTIRVILENHRVREAFQRTQLVRKGHHTQLDLVHFRTLGE